ncbi:MAG: 30S ribosomal protein S12 methylthiotransferase RimO [Alphaproteobacteria bacterium]|nr:30S ribosomal protein S12 methylthiotransferase RimO [Alphaproteobacteria bacterium]
MSTRKVHVVSLGCPKARVDTEVMVGLAQARGWELVGEADAADAIIVNTCSFLQSAIDESVDVIDEMAVHRAHGARLVVTGCLPSRFGNELAAELPDVDTFLGTSDLHRIADALDGTLPDRSYIRQGWSHLYEDTGDARTVTTRGATAFLKLAEGCNRTCTFCIIPSIRGKQRSRPIEVVVDEAKRLADHGIQELVLVAQDLTSYGTDLGDKRSLVRLLDALESVDVSWIRLMYAYPWNFTDELLDRIATSERIVRYVDMPLQHISSRVLTDMRRNISRDAQARLLDRLRAIPGMVLRSTFITGFPGETDAEFAELKDWIGHVRFDRLGVFAYSQETGTPAGDRVDQVPEEVREERRDELLALQQGIHREKMAEMLGHDVDVLVDGASEDYEGLLEGRYYGQAPDIDGVVLLQIQDPDLELAPGDFVRAHVTAHDDYDLVGTVRPEA